jgi:hypothetical protein
MNSCKVIFRDPIYNYVTSVSLTTTETDCKDYFIGKFFDVGFYPKENMQQCIDIEFIKNESTS